MTDTQVRPVKATSLLRNDHRNVKKLFASYEKLEEGQDIERKHLFEEIQKELALHSQIEEDIFYPCVAMAPDEDAMKLVMEAREEHKIIERLLAEISALEPHEETLWDAMMKVLKDAVLHHAEEEEKSIFPVFDDLDRDEKANVAEQLMSRKRELEAKRVETPDPSGEQG